MAGIFGLPNQVWKRALDWNDYYLLHNHPNTDSIYSAVDYNTIVLNTMNGDEIESYNNWVDITTNVMIYSLQKNEELVIMGNDNSSIYDMQTGKSAGITGGIAYVSATLQSVIDKQKPFHMTSIDRSYGSVFITTTPVSTLAKYRGIPSLTLDMASTANNGMIIVYLVGVDERGYGHLFSYSPWTFKDIQSNIKQTLTIPITITCYDMNPGYSVGLIITSHDVPLFMDQNPMNQTLTIYGSSILTIPLHK